MYYTYDIVDLSHLREITKANLTFNPTHPLGVRGEVKLKYIFSYINSLCTFTLPPLRGKKVRRERGKTFFSPQSSMKTREENTTRVNGIEPLLARLELDVLPLYYTLYVFNLNSRAHRELNPTPQICNPSAMTNRGPLIFPLAD